MIANRINSKPITISLIFLLSVFIPLLENVNATGGSGTITTFSDNSSSSTILLNGTSNHTSLNITLDRNTTITNSVFDISYDWDQFLPNDTPGSVILDIENDGQYEWAWNGVGYGDLGIQNLFSTGSSNSSSSISPANNSLGTVLLPQNAQVESSELDVSFAPDFGGAWISTGLITSIDSGDVDGDNLSEPVIFQLSHQWANGSNNSAAVGIVNWNVTNGVFNITWHSICDGATSIEVADYNGDNFSDVVGFDNQNSTVCPLISQSNGSWNTYSNLSLGNDAVEIDSGDMDGDGDYELISIHNDGRLNEFVFDQLNNSFDLGASWVVSANNSFGGGGGGGGGPPTLNANLGGLAIGKFWGSGNDTVVVSDENDGHVSMWNSSQGNWVGGSPSSSFDCINSNLFPIDWNGDGFLDLIGDTDTGGMCTATFNGTGWDTNITNSTQFSDYYVGDWSGNGVNQLLNPNIGNTDGNDSTLNGSLQIYSFGNNGSIQTSPISLFPHTSPRMIHLSDLDGDGLVEHIVSAGESNLGLFIAGYHTVNFDFDGNYNPESSLIGYAGDGQNGVAPLGWTDSISDNNISSTLASNLTYIPTNPNYYGTPIATISPMAVSVGNGTLSMSNMTINYDLVTTVDSNPATGNLSNSLNSQSLMQPGTGNFEISLLFNSTSQGQITVSNLNIEWIAGMAIPIYHDAPQFLNHTVMWLPYPDREHVVMFELDDFATSEPDHIDYQLFRWENGTTPNRNYGLQTMWSHNQSSSRVVIFDLGNLSGKTWDYEVRAVFNNYVFSNYSTTLTVVVPPLPPPDIYPPEAVSIVNATDVPNDSGGVIEISWPHSNSSDVDWYSVYVNNTGFSDINSTTQIANYTFEENITSHLFNTSADGISYYFGIICGDKVGNINWSVTTVGPVYSRNDTIVNSSMNFNIDTGGGDDNNSEIIATAGKPLNFSGQISTIEHTIQNANYSIILTPDNSQSPVTINGVTDQNGTFNLSWDNWLDFETQYSPLRGLINVEAFYSGGQFGLDNQTIGGSSSSSQFFAITSATLSTQVDQIQLDSEGKGNVSISLIATNNIEQILLENIQINYQIGNESNQEVSETGITTIDNSGISIISINYLSGGELDISLTSPPTWLILENNTVRVELLPPPIVEEPEEPEEEENNETIVEPELELTNIVFSCDLDNWIVTENAQSVGNSCTLYNPNNVLVNVDLLITNQDNTEILALPSSTFIFSNDSKDIQLTIKALNGVVGGNKTLEIQIILSASGYNDTSSLEQINFQIISEQVSENNNQIIENNFKPDPKQTNSKISPVIIGGIILLVIVVLIGGVVILRNNKLNLDLDDEYDEYDDYEEYDNYEEEPLPRKNKTRPEPLTSNLESQRSSNNIQSPPFQDEYDDYEEYEEEYEEEEDYLDSESYHVDDEGVEWWEDELGVWWYRYPDEEDWSEFIE